MILKSIKYRLGWTIIMAGAALATTLVMGNSLISGVVALGIVVMLGVLIPRRRRSSSADYPSNRAPGEPYSVSYSWTVRGKPDLADMVSALSQTGLVLNSRSPDRVVLRGGSQFWSRLLGGYFVDPQRLPIEVELETTNSVNDQDCTVGLRVQDKFGIAVRDEALAERFGQAATKVRNAIEAQIKV